MTDTKMMMSRCPACDSLFTVPDKVIDEAVASGAMVMISCHYCGDQFGPEGSAQTSSQKTARPAAMMVCACPACQQPISVPDPLPDRSLVRLACPLCDASIDTDLLGGVGSLGPIGKTVIPTAAPAPAPTGNGAGRPPRPSDVIRWPLYLLILAVIGGYLYWARETGQLPVDQWLRDLGIIS